MAASYVTLTLDRYDGEGNPYVKGTATFTPSLEFPDVADQMLVGMAPVTATFRAGSLPVVRLIANDTAGPQNVTLPGWWWNLTYSSDTPGSPQPASYYVLASNGGTQRLSALASFPAPQPPPVQQGLGIDGGTWDTVYGSDQVIDGGSLLWPRRSRSGAARLLTPPRIT